MKNRILSILLTLCMLLSVVPMMSFTASAAPDGSPYTATGGVVSGEYYLNGDATLTSDLTVNQGATLSLDLYGNILNLNGHKIYVYGTLNIKDNEGATTRYFYDDDSDGCYESHSISGGDGKIAIVGGVITGGDASAENSKKGGAICNYGTLNLISGNIVGNKLTAAVNNSANGGAVANFGTFNMTGGVIAGNLVCGDTKSNGDNFGGGVYNIGTFTMSAGEIKYNKANGVGANAVESCDGVGGGIQNQGTFTMNGGTISNNTSQLAGGGIDNRWSGKITLNGGSITNNSAVAGGGIFADRSSSGIKLLDGSITDNTTTVAGAGVYLAYADTNIGGDLTVTGNKTGNNINNLYIVNVTVNVDDNYTGSCGVYLPRYTGTFTNIVDENVKAHFTSDRDDYCVKYNADGQLEIGKYSVAVEENSDVNYSIYPKSAIPGATINAYASGVGNNYVTAILYYKTGDDSSTTTITNNQFIMPDYDVTVKAVTAAKKTVTLTPPTGGTLALEKGTTAYVPGETVKIKATPATDYLFDSITVTKAGGGTVEVTNNSFIMPDDNVTISATFSKLLSVTVDSNIYGGSVTASPTTAKQGDTVTLTNKAESNFTFSSYVIKTASGETVTPTGNTFIMPNESVTVSASFTFSGKVITSVPYIDVDGTQKTHNATVLSGGGATTLVAGTTDGWYVVIGNVSYNGTLTASGASKIILADGAKLTISGVGNNNPGIKVSETGNSLAIYGQSGQTGELNATGGKSGAGIGGGGLYGSGSNITINGGNVIAEGGYYGAGIGGASWGSGSYITINRGTVTATGGLYGAGIGGGSSAGSNITINGGTVTATGGSSGAGIGGGELSGSEITINGGTVTATGGNNSAGIGGGNKGAGSNIAINGGTVTATGGDGQVGIGSGKLGSAASNIKVNGELTVFADTTTPPTLTVAHESTTDLATNSDFQKRYVVIKIYEGSEGEVVKDVPYIDAYGNEQICPEARVIDANTTILNTTKCNGWYVVNSTFSASNSITCTGDIHIILVDGEKMTIFISGNNPGIRVTGNAITLAIYGQSGQTGELKVTGGGNGAGIGGGLNETGSNITINGGIITAKGGAYGAGIGGGSGGLGANITINDGIITANSSSYGAGIGGGRNASGSNITINGGIVTATGGYDAAGIGGGSGGAASNITINSGTVTASGNDNGSGIGGGNGGLGSNITINGGTVTAKSASNAAGIGGGKNASGSNITINGGTVTATGASSSAGIGNGKNATTPASDIKVSADLLAFAGSSANPSSDDANKIAHASTDDISSSFANKRYAEILSSYSICYAYCINGELSGDMTATANSTVTPVVTPNPGYELDTLTVKTVSDEDVTVTDGSFTMPTESVTVSATFKAVAHTLTIKYVGAGDTTTTVKNLTVGENYDIVIPDIAGFTVDRSTVTGTMGIEDEEIVVTYTKLPEPIVNSAYKLTYSLGKTGVTLKLDVSNLGDGFDSDKLLIYVNGVLQTVTVSGSTASCEITAGSRDEIVIFYNNEKIKQISSESTLDEMGFTAVVNGKNLLTEIVAGSGRAIQSVSGKDIDNQDIIPNNNVFSLETEASTFTATVLPEDVKNAKYYCSLTLNDNIDINFAVRNVNLDSAKFNKLKVYVNDTLVNGTLNNGHAEYIIANVEPKDMGKNFKIVVKYDGEQVKEIDYTAAKYCTQAINAYGSTSKLGELCYATLYYGECAQLYANPEATDLVTDNIENMPTYTSQIGSAEITEGVCEAGKSITAVDVSLTIDSKTSMNVYLTTNDTYKADDFLIHNSKGEKVDWDCIDFAKTSTGYKFTINDIGASRLSNSYTFTTSHDCAFKVVYGPYNYMKDVQSEENENLVDLTNAMYIYGQAAQAYYATIA